MRRVFASLIESRLLAISENRLGALDRARGLGFVSFQSLKDIGFDSSKRLALQGLKPNLGFRVCGIIIFTSHDAVRFEIIVRCWP